MSLGALEAVATLQLIYLIAAMGLYLPMSMRQLDVGAAGYFALGAYASAVLTRDYACPFPLALLAAAAAGSMGALIVDSLATRVRLTPAPGRAPRAGRPTHIWLLQQRVRDRLAGFWVR